MEPSIALTAHSIKTFPLIQRCWTKPTPAFGSAPPALPLDSEVITWAIAKQREILAHDCLEPYLTLNLIDDRSALLITNLVFDKSVGGAQARADSAAQAVLEA